MAPSTVGDLMASLEEYEAWRSTLRHAARKSIANVTPLLSGRVEISKLGGSIALNGTSSQARHVAQAVELGLKSGKSFGRKDKEWEKLHNEFTRIPSSTHVKASLQGVKMVYVFCTTQPGATSKKVPRMGTPMVIGQEGGYSFQSLPRGRVRIPMELADVGVEAAVAAAGEMGAAESVE